MITRERDRVNYFYKTLKKIEAYKKIKICNTCYIRNPKESFVKLNNLHHHPFVVIILGTFKEDHVKIILRPRCVNAKKPPTPYWGRGLKKTSKLNLANTGYRQAGGTL
jgi:hypothetical protein